MRGMLMFSPCRRKVPGFVGLFLLFLGCSPARAQEELLLDFEDCDDHRDDWICEDFEAAGEDSFPAGWDDLGAFSSTSFSRVRPVIGSDGETLALEVQSSQGTSQGVYRRLDSGGPVYTARADVFVVQEIQTGVDNIQIDIAFADPPTPVGTSNPYFWQSAGASSGGLGLWGFVWSPIEQAKLGERLLPGRWYRLTLQVDTENGTLTGHVLDLDTQRVFANQTLRLAGLQGRSFTVVWFASHHRGPVGPDSTVLFDNLVYSDASRGLNASIDIANATEGCFSEGAELRFEGRASTLEGPVNVDHFLWDFGDGSTSEGMMPTHAYDRGGRYEVTLTVSDGDFSRTVRRLICVSKPPSTPESLAPWTATDVGEPVFPGRSERLEGDDAGCFALSGGGRLLISGRTDQLHFLHQELEGDLVLSAHLSHAQAPQVSWQTGVMLRESLDPGARHLAMVLKRTAARIRFEAVRREVERGVSRTTPGDEADVPATWLRIERRGDELIGSSSTDGATWKEVNRVTFEAPLPPKLFGGIMAIGSDSRPDAPFEPLEATVCDVSVEFPSAAPHFRRGDADGSGELTVTDAVFSLAYLFSGGPSPTCAKSADTNDDGQINLADPVALLGFLFLGGPSPAVPSPECGTDPTDDELTCEFYVCRLP